MFVDSSRLRLPTLWIASLAMLLSTAAPAEAADAESATATSQEEAAPAKKRRLLFPAFHKKSKTGGDEATVDSEQNRKERHVELTGDVNAPATELPSEGIWEWVDRMEGENPTEEQLSAMEESAEEEATERQLVDDITGAPVPFEMYSDPREALAVDPLFLELVDPAEFDIPVEVNASVEKWVRYFTGPGRKYYSRWLSRSTRYRPYMYRELDKAGLPRDLVYLSMIESGYNAHAYSHAGAAGLWQFIPSTAKLYKLRVDWWVDDRRDPEASVAAAIDFLGELHGMFGDWRLAWAAYNGGPGRVRRATSRAGSKDFWTLQEGPYLHPETDNYVPKIMAAAIIGHHPERYGFTDIDYQEELEYTKVHVDGSVEFEVLARCAGTTVEEMKSLNGALRRYATPPEGYDVKIPKGKEEVFVAALAEVPKTKRITVVRHTVRRGETLSKIAAKYGTSVSSVSRANNLRNANRIYVGMALVIPRGSSSAVAMAESGRRTDASSSSSSSSGSSRPSTHTVRRGDTLSGVAGRYGVTVSQLRSWNGLSSSTIQVGQRLKLKAGQGTSSKVTHVVRRGETLGKIASRYGVSASDLQRWNNIRSASHIEVGQRLTVHSHQSGTSRSSSSWATYTVRSGDSLGKIATRNGCTVSQLRSWNNIRGSVIHPGQKLKIKK